MTTSTTERDAAERQNAWRDAFRRDLPWLALSTAVALIAYASYLTTHPYPAFGAGLFLRIAEEVAAAGYGLPTSIDGYTADGIPFAYPPLPFYLLAVLVDLLGIDAVTLSRYLPGVLVVAALPPYYYVARELLSSVPKAGLATTLLGVTPTFLRWHLSAGGVVRTLAFGFVAVGLLAGVKLFRDDGHRERDREQRSALNPDREPGETREPERRLPRQWLVLAVVAFGLTVLSHPSYAVFFGLSYLVLFWFRDRSARGVACGAIVAVGGVALAAPWWTQVIATHGVDVFAGAAGTHDGLGGGTGRIVDAFLAPLSPDPETPFFLAAYAGTGYLLYRREYLLPAWLVTAGYVIGKTRFMFVPGAMMTAVFVFDWVVPRVATAAHGRPGAERDRFRRLVPLLTVGLVIVAAAGLGVLAAAGQLSIWYGSASQPAFMDDDDRAAMTWAGEHTEPGATFVVLGDAAEWFPLLADRPILVGHWGTEWEGAGEYRRQLDLYRSVSTCETEQCVTATLSRAGVSPDYVYVPKGSYTIQGVAYPAPASLAGSMADAGRYEPVYENEGVAVFRVVGGRESEIANRRTAAVGTGTRCGSCEL